MSRIGKRPIALPKDVALEVGGGSVRVKGPRGELSALVDPAQQIEAVEGTIVVHRPDDSRRSRAFHGLTRKLIANMVHGVSEGFRRVLEIQGVGYRADVQGNALHLTLGFSHPIVFQLPEGVSAKVERQTVITLESADNQLLGQTAAMIRQLRPPEPYKGKGIRYAEERVRRKAGKAAGAAR